MRRGGRGATRRERRFLPIPCTRPRLLRAPFPSHALSLSYTLPCLFSPPMCSLSLILSHASLPHRDHTPITLLCILQGPLRRVIFFSLLFSPSHALSRFSPLSPTDLLLFYFSLFLLLDYPGEVSHSIIGSI